MTVERNYVIGIVMYAERWKMRSKTKTNHTLDTWLFLHFEQVTGSNSWEFWLVHHRLVRAVIILVLVFWQLLEKGSLYIFKQQALIIGLKSDIGWLI